MTYQNKQPMPAPGFFITLGLVIALAAAWLIWGEDVTGKPNYTTYYISVGVIVLALAFAIYKVVIKK